MNLSVTPNPHVQFAVRYTDDDFIVLDKPPRVPTQPGKGHEHDTLLNGLFAKYDTLLQNLGAVRDFGLLHRLDKNASGLLIVALRARAYDALREAFVKREIKKFYWTVCAKTPKGREGTIKLPLAERGGAHGVPKTSYVTRSRDSKPAMTAYRVLQSNELAALVEARPVTGRLHQIRVHLDAIGCPILGDEFYGSETTRHAAPRLALHAHRLVFNHPITGLGLDVQSPWPGDLKKLLGRMGLKRPGQVAESPD